MRARLNCCGRITVEPTAFEVRVEISVLLSPLRGRIEREIRAFCDEQFGKGAAPDRDQSARRPERGQALKVKGASKAGRPKSP